MIRIRRKIKDNKMLAFVFMAYVLLFIFMPEKASASFENSMYYVKEMLMIMPVILLLTSLINAWVPRKTIENSFGKQSGAKGAILSFLLGSFSAGPIYAAFPVCKMLLGKGASISNIVIILSTWAVVKIPMLINEAKFLSPRFMVLRWILTTISIFIIGYLTSLIVKEKDLPASEKSDSEALAELSIDTDYCIGCGLCNKIAPENFAMADKKAYVIGDEIKAKQRDAVKKASEKCPASVIKYSDFSQNLPKNHKM
ncbi:permease [Proteocatella sphenisci]|uniref:permease n=1 Tax=Proteocatella sphenisci TaxID=181070 RepID=UPI0004B9885A|nr:ferredoxin [Proteocatella sphenisci]